MRLWLSVFRTHQSLAYDVLTRDATGIIPTLHSFYPVLTMQAVSGCFRGPVSVSRPAVSGLDFALGDAVRDLFSCVDCVDWLWVAVVWVVWWHGHVVSLHVLRSEDCWVGLDGGLVEYMPAGCVRGFGMGCLWPWVGE
ncbi:hypothetical protein CC86DRAFT_32920 [Ophiobolus disseminans]|uniref:Uncharacterized protein n=1 Tax=Ophiobolus disseminans TaxID=1469910 RepID=A0A6A6ZX37_9PLEO|nr:hypothetical protein CC86DRAFT_32920 [Ophiobolus disseminans]